ncbi:MAG: helix-turn-helix domain-containing protein [Clostridia bacterium]|nr:helix-turn-helix domain-containing protein [Clostridia bacterium]
MEPAVRNIDNSAFIANFEVALDPRLPAEQRRCLIEILDALVEGKGLAPMVQSLAQHLQATAMVVNASGVVLVAHSYAHPGNGVGRWPEIMKLSAPIGAQDGLIARTKLDLGIGPQPGLVITLAQKRVYGYLLVVDLDSKCEETCRSLLHQAALALLLELTRQFSLQQVEQRHRNEFIQDLVYNNLDSREVLVARGRTFGWDFSHPYVVAVAELDQGPGGPEGRQRWERFLDWARTFLARWDTQVIVEERGNQAIILWPVKSAAATGRQMQQTPVRRALINALKRLQVEIGRYWPDDTFSAGIGLFYPDVTELYKSYQEAKTALEIGRVLGEGAKITTFEELGLFRFLSAVPIQNLEDFVQEVLGPLEEYDQEHHLNLVSSLEATFRCGWDLTRASASLFIHVNTLRYRLKKIEEILGASLDDLTQRTNLFVALKLRGLRRGRQR